MIVNCARGGIIHEGDLFEALKVKRVAAAAFDVFEEEPVKADHPLLTLDNFICTPHIGAQTTEAQENVAVGIAEQIVDYFTKGIARGAVNIPSVSPELLPRLQPFLSLAEQLGKLQTQLCEGGLERRPGVAGLSFGGRAGKGGRNRRALSRRLGQQYRAYLWKQRHRRR